MSEEEEVYTVESILKKKIDKDVEEATWEPVEHMDCQELIEEFERKLDPNLVEDDRPNKSTQKSKPAKSNKQTASNAVTSGRKQSKTANEKSKNGFEEGLTAECILGATDSAGELMFLIKWKERNEASLITSTIAKKECPVKVIEYLEQKITFCNE